jgi:hypothetical protein
MVEKQEHSSDNMDTLSANQIVPFLKRFRFHGGSLRVVRIRNRSATEVDAAIIVSVLDTESDKRVRLRFQFDGVEEYRFQRRPGPGLVRLREVRIGWFNGLMYLNLDPYADIGPPAVHDFRASDAFIAGRSLSWEIVLPKSQSN